MINTKQLRRETILSAGTAFMVVRNWLRNKNLITRKQAVVVDNIFEKEFVKQLDEEKEFNQALTKAHQAGYEKGWVGGKENERKVLEGTIQAEKKKWKQEALKAIKEIANKKFPRGERKWCVECAQRIETECKKAVKEI